MRFAATSAIERAAGRSSVHLSVDAANTLGAGHPLARTQLAVTIAARQAATASALLVAAPWIALIDRRLAFATGVAAVLVVTILCAVIAVLRSQRRAMVRALILHGDASTVELVRIEMGRLLQPTHRADVACRLGRTLHEAEHWNEYLPASRPPAGVRHLRPSAQAIHEIMDALHADGVSPRAVILVERFVQGGYGADAYHASGPDAVRRELGRIRFELGRQP